MSEPSGPGFTYRAFISYSHRDKAWADWLHKALETYRVPSRLVGTQTAHGTIPRRLNPVFRDREELSSSPELGTKINQALAQSENLIVICSPASAASRWVNEEVLAYKRMGRAARIFCLIVAGEPDASDIAGREAEECFCPALRFVTDADGRPTNERTEPIAADARPGKDGKPNAKLKLIAGMLDVGFDALKQREQRRQVQRMTAIAGIALGVMAVTIVLAIFALVSRHRAVIAQHEAVVAKQAAQRRQKQTEDLVNFMLDNLSDKLQAESKLDVMQDVNEKAMAYFRSLPATDVNDTELAQRAKALEKIGMVRMNQGQLSGALAAFNASITISSNLAHAQPMNVARQVAYSRTLAFTGLTKYEQSDLQGALREWKSARRLLQPSLQRAPDNLPLLEQLDFLDNDIAHVLDAHGQPSAALPVFQERLQLADRLAKAQPDDIDYVTDLGDAHNDLARLALQRGDLVTALAEYLEDDAIKTRLSAEHPKNSVVHDAMLMTHGIVGRTLALGGGLASGTHYLDKSVTGFTNKVKFDPGNSDAKNLLGLYSSELARIQRLSGNLQAASSLSATAVSVLGGLTRKYSDKAKYRLNYAEALTEQATELSAQGSNDAACKQAQAALEMLEPMLANHPDQRETLLPTIRAKLLLASQTEEPQTARALREQSLQTMQAVKVNQGDPRLLALQVEALLALGRKSETQPLIKQLWAAGYRDPALLAVLQREHIDYPVNAAFAQRLAAIMKHTPADAAFLPPPASSIKEVATHE